MGGVPDADGQEDVLTDHDVTPPWESDQRDVLRATFDQDAEAYDRSRPVAPDDVFDEVMQRASLSAGSTVVEIGPGTGQATPTPSSTRTAGRRGRTRPASCRAAGEPGGLSECQRRDGIVRVLGSRHRLLRHRLCVQFLSLDRPGHPFRQGSYCAAPGRTSRGPRNPVGRFPRPPTGSGGKCRTTGQPSARASLPRRCTRTSSGTILHPPCGHPVCSMNRRRHAERSRSRSPQRATQPTSRRSPQSRSCLRMLERKPSLTFANA